MARHKSVAAGLGAWICFEDEAGSGLCPNLGRTWSRMGHTPVVTVTRKGNTRVSMAALIAYPPYQNPDETDHDRAPAMFYSTMLYERSRAKQPRNAATTTPAKPGKKAKVTKKARKGLGERTFISLLDRAHRATGAPLLLIWDNVNTHKSARFKAMAATRPWLTVYHLPAYAPELNPVEGLWSAVKSQITSLAQHTGDDLRTLIQGKLEAAQQRPELFHGLLKKTGLKLQPEPP